MCTYLAYNFAYGTCAHMQIAKMALQAETLKARLKDDDARFAQQKNDHTTKGRERKRERGKQRERERERERERGGGRERERTRERDRERQRQRERDRERESERFCNARFANQKNDQTTKGQERERERGWGGEERESERVRENLRVIRAESTRSTCRISQKSDHCQIFCMKYL